MIEIKDDLLSVNPFSRPKTKLNDVKGIVIHYYANPNTTAKQNRDFFEKRKRGLDSYGSAHYLIGLEGEIIRAIPENEVAYHVGAKYYNDTAKQQLSNYPNDCTLGIECAHTTERGLMTLKTYDSLVDLTAHLLLNYRLTTDNLYLHFDITGKICHRWFVENPQEWKRFKEIVQIKLGV